MKARITGIVCSLLFLLPLLSEGAGAQALLQMPEDEVIHPRGDLFIENLDAVWTANDEVLEGVSILIRDGVIVEIGAELAPPSGVQILDGAGRTAIPGIVDEHSHTAMIGTNEGSAPIVPEISVLDALNPASFQIYHALSGGVTTARIMHGSSNPIGGQSAIIKNRWGMTTARELLVPGAPRSVKFALGENVTRKPAQARGPATRFPASRPGVEAIYVQAFTAAQEYRELWERYEADPGSFRAPPRRDLRLEALVDIMEDRIRVHAHSYRSDEILMLMRVADRFGFTIDNFTHILEGYRIATELREHGAGASTFSDWWQFKLESYDAIPYNATIMAEQGVLTALNSDLTWLQPFMTWEIPKPVQYGGLSKEESLRMLTLNPAIMLGVEDRVGSIEVGKDGDVVLLTGDPFDAFTRVEYTVIDGLVYYDSNREEETRGEPINPLPSTSADRYRADADATRTVGSGTVQTADLSELDPVNPGVEVVALVGGTVHPVSRPAFEDGVVVLAEGRIQAVGPRGQVEIPAGAREIDVSGRHIHPGMIDPVTHLGLFEIGAISQATDRAEIGGFNPHIRALPAYQPHGRAPFVARARGITSTLTVQTSGVIQGMGSVVQLTGDTFERAEIRGEGALMVNLPVPTSAPGSGGGGWQPFHDHHGDGRDLVWAGDAFFETHDDGHDHGDHFAMAGVGAALSFASVVGAEEVRQARSNAEPNLDGDEMKLLTEFLDRSREYLATETVSQRADQPFEANIWGGDRVALEAMAPVMRGEIPVFVRVDSEWQIRHLFLLMDAYPEIDFVLVGGAEAHRLAEEIAERDLPVILTRTRRPTPDRDDAVTAIFRAPAILHEAGVRIAFATDESADVRNLPEHVAIAISHGLPAEIGWQGVTARAAEFLGLSDEMGAIDAGMRADLLVTDGHPLQPLTRLETMFIGGAEVDPRDNDHTRAYEHFRDRR
jgi:imidazolonepropionase-like amidohydrolase